ncbi:MAG: hypothetical protein EU530_06720 [Promethearchaeota archaeon]|nr:MAG: hypothetical protein EU530_06720 [Candidatus Lokiarchaeota archaeon]
MTMGDTNDQIFKPINKKRLSLKLTNKWTTPTGLTYQKGMVGNHIAIQFFRNDKLTKTLVSDRKSSWVGHKEENIWNLIYELGGQSPDTARSQREVTLTRIMDTYLKSIGYAVIEQPKLIETTPDLLAIKGEYSCFIELKAYFGKTITGEAEIAQIIKYYNIVKCNRGIMKNFSIVNSIPPKFMLITSGKLPPLEQNAIFNRDFQNLSEEKQLEFIKKKYKDINKKMGYPRSLEGWDTRNIYKFSYDKYKKQIKYPYKIPPRVERIPQPRKLDDLIENTKDVDILLIPASVFSKMLKLSNFKKEKHYFERLRKSWLCDLILDKNLINYSK